MGMIILIISNKGRRCGMQIESHNNRSMVITMFSRILLWIAFLVISQFFIFLPVTNAHPQHDAKSTGWWQFGEGVGSSVSDASGKGNHGRVTGAEWIKDEYSGALKFDGQDDCVWCDEQGDSLSPDSALSVQAWVRPTEFRDYAFIVDHGSGWGDRNQSYRLLLR
jgi:hypothetical protein